MTILAANCDPTRVNLAHVAVATRTCPPELTEQWLYDTKSPRLALKLTANGGRIFYLLRYSSETKRTVKVRIGDVKDWSVSAARAKADEVNAAISTGAWGKREPTTLGNLVSLYKDHLKAKGARHTGYVDDLHRLNWRHLANRRIDTLTAIELAEEHNRIAASRGRVAGARAVKSMRSLLTFAMDLDLVERNVAKRVRVTDSRPRDIVLNREELALFLRVLATQLPERQDYFLLLLLTAARRSAVASMRWADLYLSPGPAGTQLATWTIPEESSKTGRTIVIPLVPQAVAILERRRVANATWVFPSPKAKSGHLVEPWYWLDEIRTVMKEISTASGRTCVNFTIHDLRRTAATIMTAAGVPLTVVAKALGHANIQTTPTYARAEIEAVRSAMEKVELLTGPVEGAAVA